jgi:hypothetical protein
VMLGRRGCQHHPSELPPRFSRLDWAEYRLVPAGLRGGTDRGVWSSVRDERYFNGSTFSQTVISTGG